MEHAYETLRVEREGVAAFLEKREARFSDD